MTVKEHKIGIISDTHGVLPYKVHEVFDGVDQIIHAGDIGYEDIITELETIAPVTAVFGNTDRQAIRKKTKERLDFSINGFDFIVTHFPLYFGDDEHPTIRISGHTHRPLNLKRRGSMLINPGSAVFPRGEYNPSVALLTLTDSDAHAEIVYI